MKTYLNFWMPKWAASVGAGYIIGAAIHRSAGDYKYCIMGSVLLIAAAIVERRNRKQL